VKPLTVTRHLTPNQIDKQFRRCRDARQKTRWQVIWLLTRPGVKRSAHAVAPLVGLSPAWAAEMVKRWNDHGPDGLVDGRRENGGRPLLSPRQQALLLAALNDRAPDGGLWTGPKVAAYVRQRWTVRIHPATGWKWLKRLGFTLQVPRPSHPQAAAPAERRGWKKSPETSRTEPASEAPEHDGRGVDGG
jgi:transposase